MESPEPPEAPTNVASAGAPDAANTCVYIHEFVDIIGHQRAAYVQHMTANWSPGAAERRGQLCYGVWSVIGSTGRWPQVVNMWEERSWTGLGRSLAAETVGPGAQDEHLAAWWAQAAAMRSGGRDRIMVPTGDSPTIEALCADHRPAAVYAHELIRTAPGHTATVIDALGAIAAEFARQGWRLIGRFQTAMASEDEVLALWAIDSFGQWADTESEMRTEGPLRRWRRSLDSSVVSWERTLLVDAPLSPLRTARQPRVSDQRAWGE